MKNNPDYSIKLLVNELQIGNEKAFRKLFDMYRSDVYRFSYSILKSEHNAEEIVQEVFLKIWMERENIDPNQSVKSLIFLITRNLSFNFLRNAVNDNKLRNDIFYQSQKSCNTTEREIEVTEYTLIGLKAVDQLPPKGRQIFKMSRDENKSYQEISNELGISISTVKNHMTKSLSSIRSFLQVHIQLIVFFSLIFSKL